MKPLAFTGLLKIWEERIETATSSKLHKPWSKDFLGNMLSQSLVLLIWVYRTTKIREEQAKDFRSH